MTQATSQIAVDQSGTAYRTQDNAGKQAILNHHKGNSAPAYAEAGIIWLNDTSTPWLLKFYDGTDWITLGEVNATNNTFQPYNGTATGRVLQYSTDSGSANAYAVTPAPAVTAYATGQIVTLKPANANTGASTLNVDALGAKNIKLLDGTNPVANALLTTGIYALMYDGTNFVMLNPSQPAFVGDSGSGGTAGLVPAPSSGDAAANKVLGAGGGWIVQSSSGVTLNAQSAGYTLLGTDKGKIVSLTGSTAETFAFTAAATLGSGWFCYLYNNSTAALTVDPNASEQIDGLTSYIMYPGEVRLVQCSGTAFTTIVLNGGTATFNSSGSWTRPPGYTSFGVDLYSGGGAGGARTTTGNVGGGGGGGYYGFVAPASKFVAAGSSETVTVGATAAGVSGNTAGTAGNSSSITVNGVVLTINGGNGGATAASSAVVYAANSGYPNSAQGANVLWNNSLYYQSATPNTLTAANIGVLTNSGVGGDVSATNVPAMGGGSWLGGAGGGSCSSTSGGIRTGGTSIVGGAGGAGGANTGGNGTGGSVPGGGGGGAVNGGTSGSGAAGEVIVRGII